MNKKLQKNLIFLVLTLIIIGLLFLIPENGIEDAVINLPKINEKITKIKFSHYDEKFVVTLEDGSWVLEELGYPIQEDKINKLLEIFSNERKAEIVSDSKIYVSYGLDDKQKLEIILFSDDQIIKKTTVGKSANRFGTYYGLEDDDKKVYQIKSDRYNLDYHKNDILNLKIVDFSPTKVNQLTIIDKNKNPFKLIRKITPASSNQIEKKIWKDSEGKDYPVEKANDIVNSIANLEASSFSPSPSSIGENKNLSENSSNYPQRKIQWLLQDDSQIYELLIEGISSQEKDKYIVSIPKKPFYYLVSAEKLEKILIKIP